jgi:isoleucyl-tRNA synthetase
VPQAAAHRLLAGQALPVSVNGETFEILPEEIEVRAQAKAGLAVFNDGAYLAALSTDLTPALVREGLAREFVRRVQDLRKQADLNISDRVRVYYEATPGLTEAVKDFRDYIQGETLAVELVEGEGPKAGAQMNDEFDGEKVTVGVVKAS